MTKRFFATFGRCLCSAVLCSGVLWSPLVAAQTGSQNPPKLDTARQSLTHLIEKDDTARAQAVKHLRQFLASVSDAKMNGGGEPAETAFLKTELLPTLKNALATRRSAETSNSLSDLLISIVRIYGKDDPDLAKSAESTIVREIARDDIDPFVRRDGLAALAIIEPLSDDTIVQIVPLIEEETTSLSLVDALRCVAGKYDTFPLARDILTSYLSHSDPLKRAASIDAVYRIHRVPDAIQEIIIERLEDPDPYVRLRAVILCGISEFMQDTPPAGLLEALMRAIRNPDEQLQTRERTASTLSRVAHHTRDPEYVDALKQIVASEDLPSTVRKRALMELPFASNYDDSLEHFLSSYTSNSEPFVAKGAADALRFLAMHSRKTQ